MTLMRNTYPDDTVEQLLNNTKKAKEVLVQQRRDAGFIPSRARLDVNKSLNGRVITALRAVVALHKVLTYEILEHPPVDICRVCGTDYPCETIRLASDIVSTGESEVVV